MNKICFVTLYVILYTLVNLTRAAVNIGIGCTTAFDIDRDCDGRGVGPNLQPDADDEDATIGNASSWQQKYSTLSAFLSATRGYTPSRFFYLSPSGSDSTGVVNDINRPYATFGGVKPRLQAGDAVVYRAGTYSFAHDLNYPALNGNANAWFYFLSFPGEHAFIDWPIGFQLLSGSYVRVEQLHFGDSRTGDPTGSCIDFRRSNHIHLRENHCERHVRGFFIQDGPHNIVVEYNTVHNTKRGTHGMYFGASNVAGYDIWARHNLIYETQWTCLQYNGRATNLNVDGNICHSVVDAVGLSFENGVQMSAITNNVVFGTSNAAIAFYTYAKPDPNGPSFSNFPPRDQKDILVANNVFVMTPKTAWSAIFFDDSGSERAWQCVWCNNGQCSYCQGSTPDETTPRFTWSNFTFANNIFATRGAHAITSKQARPLRALRFFSNVFERSNADNNNAIFAQSGSQSLNWASFMSELSAKENNKRTADARLQESSGQYESQQGRMDFSLRSGSPAIGLADARYTPPFDIRGAARAASGADAGAYERGSGGIPVELSPTKAPPTLTNAPPTPRPPPPTDASPPTNAPPTPTPTFAPTDPPTTIDDNVPKAGLKCINQHGDCARCLATKLRGKWRRKGCKFCPSTQRCYPRWLDDPVPCADDHCKPKKRKQCCFGCEQRSLDCDGCVRGKKSPKGTGQSATGCLWCSDLQQCFNDNHNSSCRVGYCDETQYKCADCTKAFKFAVSASGGADTVKKALAQSLGVDERLVDVKETDEETELDVTVRADPQQYTADLIVDRLLSSQTPGLLVDAVDVNNDDAEDAEIVPETLLDDDELEALDVQPWTAVLIGASGATLLVCCMAALCCIIVQFRRRDDVVDTYETPMSNGAAMRARAAHSRSATLRSSRARTASTASSAAGAARSRANTRHPGSLRGSLARSQSWRPQTASVGVGGAAKFI